MKAFPDMQKGRQKVGDKLDDVSFVCVLRSVLQGMVNAGRNDDQGIVRDLIGAVLDQEVVLSLGHKQNFIRGVAMGTEIHGFDVFGNSVLEENMF